MKKRLALLLAAVLTLTAVTAGCGSKEETENKSADESSEAKTEYVQKEEGDEFIVGFDQDFPPMGFVGDDGEYTGFDLELAEEVCNRMGWKFTPKPIAWDSKDAAQAALDDNQDLVSTFANLQVIPDYNTGFMDLESGAVDAVAMDIVVASYQIEKRSAAFKILDYEIAAEEYGVGFAKGNEALRDQVQSALEEMAKDGTLAEISTKWFGEDITTIGK